ncbi:MAG: hypothetical protein J6R25_04100 [Bacteroidales bacterium]|nr:hypothetical protein [Bacteroidales bacterium]
MEIIKATEGLSKKDIYKMVNDPAIKKIKEGSGLEVTLISYVRYMDTNNSGNEVDLLAINTDQGIFATNSKTFIEDFERIIEQLGEPGDEWTGVIKIIEDISKNGRTFYQCGLVD